MKTAGFDLQIEANNDFKMKHESGFEISMQGDDMTIICPPHVDDPTGLLEAMKQYKEYYDPEHLE